MNNIIAEKGRTNKAFIISLILLLSLIFAFLSPLSNAQAEDNLAITYNANGGKFSSGDTQNTVYYKKDAKHIVKTSKSSNVSDDGTSYSDGYGDNQSTTDVVTIPGAESLTVTITYETESADYDWVAIYDGSVTPNEDNDYDSISGKLGGGPTTVTFTVEGDTVQFFFRSDGSVSDYFGYYASIEADGQELTAVSGTYEEPTSFVEFLGWYTDSECTEGNEFDIANYNVTEEMTVYAKYSDYSILTYDANGGTFTNGQAQNNIFYSVPPEAEKFISKTPNVNDDGATYNGGYGDEVYYEDVVTIEGAESLKVTITYETDLNGSDIVDVYNSSWDWVGRFYGERATETFITEGDTVHFQFYSDDADNDYYGYYAIVEEDKEQEETAILSGTYEDPTYAIEGVDFLGWYTDVECTEGNEFDISTFTGKDDLTVYAKYRNYMVLTHDANGGTFKSGDTQKEVYYAEKLVNGPVISKISKTSGIDDAGTSEYGGYENNMATTDIVTIPGAESLTVTITYATEPNSDWVALYDGSVTPNADNYDESISGKLSGGYYDKTTKTFTVEGDTAQFFFKSNTYNAYYGYYAVVEGAGKVLQWSLASGYEAPLKEDAMCVGWYTDPECTEGNEFNPETDIPNLQSGITVYAKYKKILAVTYDANGGTFSSGESQNVIGYEDGLVSKTQTSKTSNVSDDGTSYSGGYGDNQSTTDVVTIPGAESLTVTITYETESTSYDWVCIYDGSVTPNTYNDYDSISGKLGGNLTTETFTVEGDTVQFFFSSDSSASNYFGYYAVIEYESQGKVVAAGTYQEPTSSVEYAEFAGWYTDAECTNGNEFNPETDVHSLESGITVYAKYVNSFVVTYNANNGLFENGSSENIVIYSALTGDVLSGAYDEPTRSGYGCLLGWYTNPECTDGNEVDINNITESATVYAQYSVPFTITFDSNGGDTFSNDQNQNAVTYASLGKPAISKTSNVSEDGSSSTGGYGTYNSFTDIFTFKDAERIRVTITYATSYTSYAWVSIYDGSVTPSESNYNSSISGKLGGQTKTTKTFTVEGDTVQIFFNSTHYGDSYFGYYATIIPEHKEFAGAYEVPTNSDVEYSEFAGWYSDPDCTEGNEVDIYSVDKDMTFYAKYTNPYYITFNANGKTFTGGSAQNVVAYNDITGEIVNGSYVEPTTDVPYGQFMGWYTNPECTGTKVTVGNVREDTVLYAQYSNPYSITYDANGGVFSDGSMQNLVMYNDINGNTVNGSFKTPTREGYGGFEGWYTDSACTAGNKVDPATIREDITVYAKFNKLVTVTYNANGGTFETGEVENAITYEETVNNAISGMYRIPSSPDESFKFGGWYTDADCTDGNEFYPNTATDDITVYAKYNASRIVTYDANGGAFSSGNTQNVVGYTSLERVSKIVKAPNTSEDGLTYSGTYSSYGAMTEKVTIEGAKELRVTVTYQTSASSLNYVAVYDGSVTPTTSNSNSSVSGNLYGASRKTETFIVKGDTVQFFFRNYSSGSYYGYYAIVEGYTLSSIINGEYEEPVHPAANSIFVGWYADTECTEGNEVNVDTISEDKTIYAKYKYPYTVTYDANGGAFEQGSTQNTVDYRPVAHQERIISKTSNVSEDGTTTSGYYPYTYPGLNDIITIHGAEKLKVTITYETKSYSDWVAVYDGSVTPNRNNYNDSISGRLGYSEGKKTTKTFIVEGDTVQIYFYSTYSNQNLYGYYATVEAATVAISDTYQEPIIDGGRFAGWYTSPECIEGTEFDKDVALNSDITVYAKYNGPYTVTYDANGGVFSSGASKNKVVYRDLLDPVIKKTSNVSADGSTFSGGYENYSDSYANVKIEGAEKLKVTITYQTEGEYGDWVCVYDGSVTPNRNNYNDSISGKLAGRTKTTKTFIIDGDTARIYFKTDGSGNTYYGYYAIVEEYTGLDPIFSGGYQEPSHMVDGSVFEGWYTTPTFAEGSKFNPNLDIAYLESDITVYAKYIGPYTIVYHSLDGIFSDGTTENTVVYSGESILNETSTPTIISGVYKEPYFDNDMELIGWYSTPDLKAGTQFVIPEDFKTLSSNSILHLYAKKDIPIDTYSGRIEGNGTWEWILYEDGTLKLYPTDGISGQITSTSECNWGKDKVKKIIVEGKLYAPNSSKSLFSNHPYCREMDLSGLDTSKVTNMSSMFYDCASLINLDLSNFDTSNVTNMYSMFYSCKSLTELDLSSFDTSKVTTMQEMFRYCNSLTELDLSSFDTSKVTDMSSMFSGCSSLTELDLSSFDTSNVTDMSSMFSECSSLTELDLSNFDTSNVTDMSSMFYDCNSLTSLDLSNFDTSNATSMSYMFKGCNSLTELDLSNFDTSNVPDMTNMFFNCKSLTELDLSSFDTSNVTSMSAMFYDCNSLTELDLSNFDTSNVTTMTAMFMDCKSLTSLDLSNFDTSNVRDMCYYSEYSPELNEGIFMNCSSLTSLDISNFDTSNVTCMYGMFYNCSSLVSLNLSSFDTSNVENMKYMFYNCRSLVSLDSSSFDTSKVTNMTSMFYNCNSLTELDLSSFDTSNVTIMFGMFYNCNSLTELDLSSFDTSNVTTMQEMFKSCSSLISLDLSSFTIHNGCSSAYMFSGMSATKVIFGENELSLSYQANLYGNWIKTKNPDGSNTNDTTVYNWREIYSLTNTSSPTLAGTWEKPEIQSSGECGGCFWELNAQGVFRVWPKDGVYGELETWFKVPYADQGAVYKVVIEKGVALASGTTNQTFSELPNCVEMDLSGLDTSNATSMSYMFKGCNSLTKLDLSSFDTSNVTNMDHMFSGCSSLASLDLSNFDTSNVTNMISMFNSCESLTELDLSSFDTSNVTDMSAMFYDCNSLTELDLSSFDTSNVSRIINPSAYDYRDGKGMFENCSSLISLDLSNFDTRKIEDMSYMFQNCSSLTSLDLSSFDTSNVTDMSYMFGDCSKMRTLILGEFKNTNTADMDYMFFNCKSLTELDLSSFDTSNVTTMTAMFYNCNSLTDLDLSSFDTSNVTTMSSMFYNCNSLTDLDLSSFDTSNVEDMGAMFSACSSLTSLDLSNFDTTAVIDMRKMFEGCNSLGELDISNFNTSKVEDMGHMFENCHILDSLDLSSFNTLNVTDMAYMFRGCYALTELNVSSFDTAKVLNMSSMFMDCRALKELDISNFNTSSVTNMSYMFSSCNSLENINLSNFDTAMVNDMSYMFQLCSNLIQLDLSSFDTTSVKTMSCMFSRASKLETLNISSFDTTNVTNMSSMFSQRYYPLTSLSKIILGNSFKFKSSNMFDANVEGNWIQVRDAEGGKTHDDTKYTSAQIMTLTANTTPTLGGVWVREGSSFNDEHITNPDGSVEYISQDGGWTIVSDTVWTYTFSVFDDTLTYHLFEEFMDNYVSEAMAPYYITIVDNKATITNTSNTFEEPPVTTGRLIVQKTVVGENTQSEFAFTITLTGNEISGTQIFGGVAFKNGVGSFILKDGESKVFELPEGVMYNVEEKAYTDYTTTYSESNTGTITVGTTQTVVVTNTYEVAPEFEDTVDITVIKKIEGDVDTSDKFSISAYMTGLKPNKVYTMSNGESFTANGEGIGFCNLAIGKDEEVVISDIPVGAQYQFTESAGEYTSSYSITVDGSEKASGNNNNPNTATSTENETVEDAESIVVTFTNKIYTVQNLTISKVVKEELEDGSIVDLNIDESYEFTVIFSNMNEGASFNSTIGKVVADEDGEAYKTFYLKNGESAEFFNIPVGVKYTVEESASVYEPSYVVTGTSVTNDSETGSKRQKLSTETEIVDVNENSTITFTNVKTINRDKAVRLIKSIDAQGNPDIIEMLKNNRMYHLDGAEYELVIDGEVVETLVTDVDGEAISTQVFADGTTGILREVKAPDGFLLSETEYTFTIDTSSADAYCDVNVSDVPTFDPAIIRIKKTDGGTGTAQGNTTFEGAIFKYEYYDNLDWSGVPTRTWYFATDSNGMHAYHPDYLADGYVSAELYEPSEGSYLIPLGSVKITEVVAPAGYKVMPVMYATITQVSSGADAKWTYTQETLAFLKAGLDDLYEGEEPIDEAKLGGLTIQKLDAATNTATPAEGATFEGCEFTIYNKSANAVKIGDNEVAQPNEACMVIVVGADGKAVTGNVLPIGTYEVKETKGNSFYSCNTEWSYTFTVDGTTDNAQFNTECANVETPEVTILKVDNEYNALAGAKLQIKDADGNVIAEWTSTTEDFKIRLAEGTYVLHEQLPPYGYTWAEDIEFTVTNDDANTVIMVDVPLTVMVSTGGEGIIKIVVLSIVLGGIAGVLVYVGKKKANKEDESEETDESDEADKTENNVDKEVDTE